MEIVNENSLTLMRQHLNTGIGGTEVQGRLEGGEE